MHIELVTTREQLTALGGLDGPVVGVDVERADGHHYFRSAALVQVGVAGRCVVVDALALPDLPELERFLAGRVAVLHALENDLEPLSTLGVRPSTLADTAVAAALLGLPTGLSPLLEEVLGVELSEDKERFQRADWTRRPLPDDMLAYAAGDVVHLAALWGELAARLERTGRRSWYEQELAAVAARPLEDRRGWARTRGIGRLSGHGRAVLRALWEERETIARSEDVAPQRVARDEALIAIAADPPRSVRVLVDRGLRHQQLRRYGQRLLAAVRRGASSPDEPSPGGRSPSDDDRAAYDRMRRARTAVAEDLGLDPGVLCPSRRLLAAVLADPGSPDELVATAGLRPWQAEVLRAPLWRAYRGDAGGAGT